MEVQNGTGLYSYTSGMAATEQNITGIPVVGQLPSRTVHSCTGIPGEGQMKQLNSSRADETAQQYRPVQVYQG